MKIYATNVQFVTTITGTLMNVLMVFIHLMRCILLHTEICRVYSLDSNNTLVYWDMFSAFDNFTQNKFSNNLVYRIDGITVTELEYRSRTQKFLQIKKKYII